VPVLTKGHFPANQSRWNSLRAGSNTGAHVCQLSRQITDTFDRPYGAALAKCLSALARKSNKSGALREVYRTALPLPLDCPAAAGWGEEVLMWSDNETTVDYLNFGVIADACVQLLQRSKGEPISVGVSGGWGVGKTSLVRMIEKRLPTESDGGHRFVMVTFNPWLYQDFDSARSALLQIVGDKVLELAKGNESLFDKAKDLLARIKVLRVMQLGGEVAASIFTGIPLGAMGRTALAAFGRLKKRPSPHEDGAEPAGEDDGADFTPDLLDPAKNASLPSEIQGFRDRLETLLAELTVTLVVFVDDLDRCLPQTAISTLESIRLLLFTRNTAFVIAADNDFIRSAVRTHFQGADLSDDLATSYFDKLIQVPLHVPRLGVNEAKAYLAMLLMEHAHSQGKLHGDKFAVALEAVPKRLQASWKGETITSDFLDAQVGVDNKDLIDLMRLAEGLAPLLSGADAVKANPRLMKRFLNTVYLRAALSEPQGIKVEIPALAKWHLLERCNENLAKELAGKISTETDGRLPALAAAEDGTLEAPFEDNAFTREWLKLPPKLGDMDLRPILHLSRDSVARDFGVDDLSASGRALRDSLLEATGGNAPLTALIQTAGEAQAGIAMRRVWQLKSRKRDWSKASDVVELTEVCKVFPGLGPAAASLLKVMPASQLSPALAIVLDAAPWAAEVLKEKTTSPDVESRVTRALAAQRRKH
jgi:predicted KAP-like P-loop ATPase